MAKKKKREMTEDAALEIALRDHPEWRRAWERGDLPDEISGEDAKHLLTNGVWVVSEGANMPSEPAAVHQFVGEGILYGPGKAANAGGVATSGLEMAQNAGFTTWTRETVDDRLLGIMADIHRSCRQSAEEYGSPDNYVMGANVAGFEKVARAMVAQGVV